MLNVPCHFGICRPRVADGGGLQIRMVAADRRKWVMLQVRGRAWASNSPQQELAIYEILHRASKLDGFFDRLEGLTVIRTII